jgi:predicted O-methyltransferase YrrM
MPSEGAYGTRADREVLLTRVRAVRRRLAREVLARIPGSADDFALTTFPERDCDALRDTLIAERAASVIEVGLAYGSSALAIGEALVTTGAGRPRHVVLDPYSDAWSNIGWHVIQEAGLAPYTTLVTERSQLYLPRLAAQGFVADAAFVDGSHHFHDVFVDLYFLRMLVRPGGMIILDDLGSRPVATAARYYETHTGWQAVPSPLDDVMPARGRGRAQAYRLPDPPVELAVDDDSLKPFWISKRVVQPVVQPRGPGARDQGIAGDSTVQSPRP